MNPTPFEPGSKAERDRLIADLEHVRSLCRRAFDTLTEPAQPHEVYGKMKRVEDLLVEGFTSGVLR